MDNIIKELMENEKPFGLMSKEMQEKLKACKHTDIECLQSEKHVVWHICGSNLELNDVNNYTNTFRLRSDYKEEPEVEEVVKFDIYNGSHGKLWFNHGLGGAKTIDGVATYSDFLGFEYANQNISISPRLFEFNGELDTLYTHSPDCKVLTPTHVLFKGKSK